MTLDIDCTHAPAILHSAEADAELRQPGKATSAGVCLGACGNLMGHLRPPGIAAHRPAPNLLLPRLSGRDVVMPGNSGTSFAAGKVLVPLRKQEFLFGTAGVGCDGGLVPRQALSAYAGPGGIGNTTAHRGHESRAGSAVFPTAKETLHDLHHKLARMSFSETERQRLEEQLLLLSMYAPEIEPVRSLVGPQNVETNLDGPSPRPMMLKRCPE